MKTIDKILVPVDFTPCSDAALACALVIADGCGAEVEALYAWTPPPPTPEGARAIFADTPEGIALEQRLSAAESEHPRARVAGRLEFGDVATVVRSILEREHFDLVVAPHHGHVTATVASRRCSEVPVSGTQLIRGGARDDDSRGVRSSSAA